MSATTASGARRSASITSCGFCHSSRAGSSKTCAHLSASLNECWCSCGACAHAAPTSVRKTRGNGARLASAMEKEKRLWSAHLANLARAAFWITMLVIVVTQLVGSRSVDRQRAALLGQFEESRKSRVIALIHRQESASILGVPVAESISIDDSEAVLRAIRLT